MQLSISGQISAQRCILEVSKLSKNYPESVGAYREEAIIRRELSDNFCFYNSKYDSIKGAPNWAQTTLNDHKYVNFVTLFSQTIFFFKYQSYFTLF